MQMLKEMMQSLMNLIKDNSMETEAWGVLKVIGPYLMALITALGSMTAWMYKKQHNRVDKLENRLTDVEKSTAVIQVMVDGIKDDIREIKQGIEKLTDGMRRQ